MKKSYSFVCIIICFCMFFVMGTFTIVHQSNAEEVITWKCQNYFMSKASIDNMNKFLDRVKQKSNGRLVIKGYSANQLVKVKGVLDAVSKGAIEVGWGVGVYHTGKIPEAAIEFGLPFSWDTWDEVKDVYHKYGLLEKIRDAYGERGIYFLSPLPAGGLVLLTKKRLESLEDIKGLKIRSTGMEAKILTTLGVSTVHIPGSELYTALQRGTVDGAIYVAMGLSQMKFREVLDYIYYPPFNKVITDVYIGQKAWNSLTPDLQKIVQESIDEILDEINEGHKTADAFALLNCLIDRSLKGAINFSDADVAKLRTIALQEWEKIAAKSPRCAEMIDIIKRFAKDKGKI